MVLTVIVRLVGIIPEGPVRVRISPGVVLTAVSPVLLQGNAVPGNPAPLVSQKISKTYRVVFLQRTNCDKAGVGLDIAVSDIAVRGAGGIGCHSI